MIDLRSAAVLALMMLTPAAAWAGLEICNETSAKLTVAIGYKDGDDWVSEGWWNIAVDDCATPLKDELTGRFYYYRALVSGREFRDENIAFCTVGKAFTIVGDSNCDARGYDKSMFSKIDTGKTAKHFTFTITEAGFPTPTEEPTPEPELESESSSTAPGTDGRPFVESATLQECLGGSGERYCSFHADGMKFFVADDGRTPSHIFNSLQSMDIGSPITVEGDVVAVYGHTSEIVLRSLTTRSWSGADILLDKMQGQWYAKDDQNTQFTILGSERENTNSGAITGMDYLSVQEWCAGFESSGSYLYVR
ncbi:MAG: putative membrane protein, partial [Granulosicoccus sp.]